MRPAAPILALLAGLSATAAAAPLKLSPCRLKGLSTLAACGVLDVPEDRAHPERRTLHLKVAVLRSLASRPAPDPLFLLAGGPGQSALDSLGPFAETSLQAVRRERDLVLVDQRGTGASNPLECKLLPDDAPLADQLRDDVLSPEAISRCIGKWSADLTQYGTSVAMQDLDDVRAALGYDRIDLWGGSYGTRAALVYLREHGAHVRAMVLDGVAPLQQVLPTSLARDAQRALDLLLQSCADDAACARAYPDLRGRLQALLAALGRAPAHATVAHPLTGTPTEVTITRQSVVQALRGLLYVADFAALLPLTIDHAARGDWAPFVAQDAGIEVARGMYLGLLFATTCAEDLPYTSERELEEQARGTFLGPELARTWLRICKSFPPATARPGFRDPVRSDVPVLLLSGELDPVTPPSWAEEAKKTLPSSMHVVVPGVGHGVSIRGCVPRLIERFLTAGSTAGLDASCVRQSTRPPFFVGFAGPTP